MNISETTSAAARHEARNVTKIRHRLTKDEFQERIFVSCFDKVFLSFFFVFFNICIHSPFPPPPRRGQEVTLQKTLITLCAPGDFDFSAPSRNGSSQMERRGEGGREPADCRLPHRRFISASLKFDTAKRAE